MTLPNERTRALLNIRHFMRRLMDRSQKIKVSELRREAYYAIKHYPADYEIQQLAEACPHILEPFKSDDDSD